ncbi:hypothetical protein J2T21_000349 [Paeniglutamicibacter psychrophenolicus]|nr:hypothetical protein [Paeniglutamicibacter psychrophenolicus]
MAGETAIVWNAHQKMRLIYYVQHADAPEQGQALLSNFSDCPIPEIKRLGKTFEEWQNQPCAHFSTKNASSGHTEFINIVIEIDRRIARDSATSRGAASARALRRRPPLLTDSGRPLQIPMRRIDRGYLCGESPTLISLTERSLRTSFQCGVTTCTRV